MLKRNMEKKKEAKEKYEGKKCEKEYEGKIKM